MPKLSILLLGQTDRAEFEEARAAMNAWGNVYAFAETDAAARALAEGHVTPDVMIVTQAFPGQFSHEAIDRLRRLAPLARIVGLLGSWCEGEMRTGSPWPGVVRTYWHQWAARCHRELGCLAQGQSGTWTLPPTATEEERLLTSAREPWPRRHGVVVIRARSRETVDWLSAACRQRGYATVWQRTADAARVEGATAAIFDAADLSDAEYDGLHRLSEALRPAPVVALLTYPRIEDHRRALAMGAAAVLSKPLALDDLFGELDRVARLFSPC